MGMSRIDGVKAPPHDGTPRSGCSKKPLISSWTTFIAKLRRSITTFDGGSSSLLSFVSSSEPLASMVAWGMCLFALGWKSCPRVCATASGGGGVLGWLPGFFRAALVFRQRLPRHKSQASRSFEFGVIF